MRRLPRVLVLSLVVLAVIAAGVLLSRRLPFPGARAPAVLEGERREAQAVELRRYLERRSVGTLLPANDVAIAVRDDFLQRLVALSLPFTQTFADGRYVARLDSAKVDLLDGLALVTLRGRGMLASDTTLFAELVLTGRLSIAGVDDSTGQLKPRLEITDVRVVRAGSSVVAAITNPAIRFFSLQKLQEWNELQSAFHLPLKIESLLRVPAVEGDLALPEARLPLAIRLSSVVALEHRLVVSLELLPETDSLHVGPAPPRAPWELPPVSARARPAHATAEAVLALRDSVRAFGARDSLWRAILLADRDLVIVTPRSVLAELAYRVARRYRSGAQVDFRPEIHETLDREIRVKVLGQRVGAGRIHVDIRVRHLVGRLETPGEPQVRFRPPDALDVTLPIRITGAGGAATVEASWDPAALVSVVCRSFSTRQTLTGIIRPQTHEAQATIHFTLGDLKIVGRPRVRQDRVRLALDLDERSWDKLRAVFEEQDRFGRCGLAMNPDSMIVMLRRIGWKGVTIRLPADLLPEFELPVSFADVYEQGELRVAVAAYRPELLVRGEFLRFGVDGGLRVVQRADRDSVDHRPTPAAAPRF
ncbi:MAG: hypothetical protein ABI960_06835 [Candidatus Eisenbacteria bacterium]